MLCSKHSTAPGAVLVLSTNLKSNLVLVLVLSTKFKNWDVLVLGAVLVPDFEFNSRRFHSDSINWVGDSFAQFNSTRTRFNSIEFNSFCPKNFFRSRFSPKIVDFYRFGDWKFGEFVQSSWVLSFWCLKVLFLSLFFGKFLIQDRVKIWHEFQLSRPDSIVQFNSTRTHFNSIKFNSLPIEFKVCH